MLDTLKKALVEIVMRSDTNDMTVRQLVILTCLSDGPRTVRDIADETNLAKPSISRAGDKLEYLGFARRDDDPDDRRSVLLVMTPAGKRFLAAISKA